VYKRQVRTDEIPVDASEFEDLPTEPALPRPERTTERPSAYNLAALVEASRDPQRAQEPHWVVDPDSGCLALAEPYRARQSDAHGTTFLVECPVGLELDPPATRAQARAIRTALVSAALKVSEHAWIIPPGGPELWTPLDDQWRRAIVTAFRDGDAGVRQRG
jgi:hypothetical protein